MNKYDNMKSQRLGWIFVCRIHVLELLMGLFLFYCAIYDIVFGRDHFYIYLLLQSGAFFVMGFGYVGTFVPN